MNHRLGLEIRTPEGVAFSYELAGPISRFLAWAVDCMVVIAFTTTVMSLTAILELIAPDLGGAVVLLLFFATPVFYGILTEWFWRGQTLGKRLMRLRVIDEQGLRLQFSQVVVRNLVRFVDSLPLYLIGGVAVLFSKKAQRLGDLAASTVVVRMVQPARPDLEQIMGGKYNSLRSHPHLEARLRQRVTPRDASVALQAIIRRDSLLPDARVELFEDLAKHFKSLVEFPQEATDGVTDEQYVRNVVDVIFRK